MLSGLVSASHLNSGDINAIKKSKSCVDRCFANSNRVMGAAIANSAAAAGRPGARGKGALERPDAADL